MELVSDRIKSGAKTFLLQEYLYLSLFCLCFGGLVYLTAETSVLPYITVAFLIGAATSMICGYLGMLIAVDTNWKVTYACNSDIDSGFHVAFSGGQVLGFALVGIALGVLHGIITVYAHFYLPASY